MRLNSRVDGTLPRRVAKLAAFLSATTLALTLAGCGLLGGDNEAPASAFSQALAKDYSDLSAQAAAAPTPPDQDTGFFDGLFGSDGPTEALAKAFSDKADIANRGEEPAPEPAGSDPLAQSIRARMVRDVDAGKGPFPEQAARSQADFDCWILNGQIPSQASAAQACKSALDGSLIALEAALRPAPPPAAPIIAPPPPPASNFTVYFNFDSWTLTAEDLAVITQVINTARAGGQSHIIIVGHTDTSGSADYNQKLSVRRANVVVEALVDMGARRAAVTASGVGETDLAVQTPDGVKEAKNRRSVVTLQP